MMTQNTTYKSTVSLFISLSLICEAMSIRILQLGDSFSSGNGAGGYYDNTCIRSEKNWGNTASIQLGSKYENEACSGAEVSALESQSNAIDECTDLILLATGGNDLGFQDVVLDCFIPNYQSRPDCVSMISFARDALPSYQANLQEALVNLHRKTRDDAKIVLTGYPHITQDKNYVEGCCGFSGSNLDVIADLRLLGQEIDEAQQNAVDGAHSEVGGENFVYFFSTKELFSGHEPDPNVWDENPNGWVYEWSCDLPYEDNYHLNPKGHEELGNALALFLQDLINNGSVSSPSPMQCSDAPTLAPVTNTPPTARPTQVLPYTDGSDDGCNDDCGKSSLLKIIKYKFLMTDF